MGDIECRVGVPFSCHTCGVVSRQASTNPVRGRQPTFFSGCHTGATPSPYLYLLAFVWRYVIEWAFPSSSSSVLHPHFDSLLSLYSRSRSIFTVMPPQPCPDRVQNGVCLRQGCPFDHNVRRCIPCGTNIPAYQMPEHVQSSIHRERVASQAAQSSTPSHRPNSNSARTPTAATQPSQPTRPPRPSQQSAPRAPPTPVPNRARAPNPSTRTPQPPSHQRTVSGVSICNICNSHVRTEELEAHIRQHSRPAPTPAPGPARTARSRAAAPAPAPAPAPDGGNGNGTGNRNGGDELEDYVQVSHIDGGDFGTVERDNATGAFPPTPLNFSVTKRRPQALVHLLRVVVVPVEDVDENPAATVTNRYISSNYHMPGPPSNSSLPLFPSSFFATIQGRLPGPAPIDGTVTVRVLFQPTYEGRFEDTLNFVFLDHRTQSEFIISRALRGIAGSPHDYERLRNTRPYAPAPQAPREPPRVFIPLVPIWTSTHWENRLQTYDLPQEVLAAIPSHDYEAEAEKLVAELLPSFGIETYAKFFHTLLHIEEGAVQ